MSNLIKVWRPPLTHPGFVGLTVPYSGRKPMTRELYELVLVDRLKELIDQNPQQAKIILTSSPEHLPDLNDIAYLVNPKDWPGAILACGQMQMCLDRINFQKGQNLTLEKSELPSLEQITEALPG